VALRGDDLEIMRPRDAEALVDERAFAEEDEFLPYWAELWPAGVGLARALDGRALRGVPVLELGCGLGLPSIVAARAGGRVLATDWSPDAVAATAANAERNGVQIETLECSWADPDAILEPAPWPLVLASDVLYEARNVELLLDLLPRLVDETGLVLSAGITELAEEDDAEASLGRAEHAVWQATQAGRGTIVVAVPNRRPIPPR